MHDSRLPDWRAKPELARLSDLVKPPQDIYIRGTWDPSLFSHSVAIIGSRRITQYGRNVIDRIVPQVVYEGKTIISGFMYGVDQYAHQVCIDHGGRTIAVLGWGISEPLSPSDESLATAIIRHGGLLVSEWEQQAATLWTFPVRNRIVAALAHEVIVIEAASKSGSLITANIARKLGRMLWAVPGPITSKTSEGTNALIASGHARLWQQLDTTKRVVSDDPLVQTLEEGALTASELARKLSLPVSDVGAQLSLLTLGGQLIERDGKYYVGQN